MISPKTSVPKVNVLLYLYETLELIICFIILLEVSFGSIKMSSWSLTHCLLKQVAQKQGGGPIVMKLRLERYLRLITKWIINRRLTMSRKNLRNILLCIYIYIYVHKNAGEIL